MSDGSDGVGSAVCFSPLERRDLLGFVSSLEQRERERERGLCLTSPGDTTK